MRELENILSTFDKLTLKPQDFLSGQGNLTDQLKLFLKNLYDFHKATGVTLSDESLPELIIDDFDDEQIWQELELDNRETVPYFVKELVKFMIEVRYKFNNNSEFRDFRYLISDYVEDRDFLDLASDFVQDSDNSEVSDGETRSTSSSLDRETEDDIDESRLVDSVSDEEGDDGESRRRGSTSDQGSDVDESRKGSNGIRGDGSAVDDKFFKLSEMEAFSSSVYQPDTESDDEMGDGILTILSEGSNEGEEDNIMYSDFFEEPSDASKKPVTSGKNKFEGEESEKPSKRMKFSDDESERRESENTQFQRKSKMLSQKIDSLTAQALEEKPWQMKGEVGCDDRPVNSLLEEAVEFNFTQRPAPVVTEETTLKLEDVILERIKQRAFDNVEKKVKPVFEPKEYKKALVLDQEKSKLSLAEIYAAEYVRQREDKAKVTNDTPEEEPPEHVEIKKDMQKLFRNLDSLSNFHFTPKPAIPEIKIVSNVSALEVEEVAPVTATDATLLAPEEVIGKRKTELIAKEEMTKAQKKKMRRHKKARLRANKLKSEEKSKARPDSKKNLLKQVTKAKNTSQLSESRTSIKTSKDFFSELEQTSDINKKQTKKKKNSTPSKKNFKF